MGVVTDRYNARTHRFYTRGGRMEPFLPVPAPRSPTMATTVHDSFQNVDLDKGTIIMLEQEDTKLWHLSALTLFNMFDEEKKTGAFTFPEEA